MRLVLVVDKDEMFISRLCRIVAEEETEDSAGDRRKGGKLVREKRGNVLSG